MTRNDKLLVRLEIEELIADFAFRIDHGRSETVAEFFTRDGWYGREYGSRVDTYREVDGTGPFASQKTIKLFVEFEFPTSFAAARGRAMTCEQRLTASRPSFDITRASHVVLTARDLEATRAFYCDVLGFQLSDQTSDALFLRGLDEKSHHSLVFQRSADAPVCRRIGLRVFDEDDLDEAFAYFKRIDCSPRWFDAPYLGRTLHVEDAIGTPLEFCSVMDDAPWNLQRFELYKGGSPMRLDHFQIVAHDVRAATDFYLDLGFRLTEYTATEDEIWGSWLQRKGNPHDIVFSNGRGPRLHHFAYGVPETRDIIHACDVAGSLGFGKNFERGPGRHGIGNALFVYFRDPDGHRVELFNAHYQAIDINHQPLRWDLSDTRRSQLWGLPAPSKWFFEATQFAGVTPRDPTIVAAPMTLERFLADQY